MRILFKCPILRLDGLYYEMPNRIKDGFEGQQLLVLPQTIVGNLKSNSITSPLYFTHIGRYPKARHHFVERANGAGEWVLIYCVEGKGWYRFLNQRHEVSEGQFFVLPKKGKHQYGSADGQYWGIYFLHFAGNIAPELFVRLQGKIRQTQGMVKYFSKRIDLFDEMYNTLESGYSMANLEHANMCLWRLLDTFIYHSERYGRESLPEEEIVSSTLNFMKISLAKKLTLSTLAEQSQLSVSHFSTLFRQATGYAPIDYFIRLKIQKACQYLDLTRMQVKEIAYEVGFDDPYYFSRLFKKVMGESPLDYRNRQK